MNPSTNLTVGPPPFKAREAEFVPNLTQAYNKIRKAVEKWIVIFFSKVDGKSIIVYDFEITHNDDSLCIKMSCISEDQNAYFIVFENISKLKLSDISYPFQICGFEILDYNSRGYQSDSRFFVNDYEDETLSFFCEKFEIFNANR